MKRIEAPLETRILALLARGDKYDDIVASLARDGESVNKNTIVAIKKRNTETLKYMQGALVQHELNKSTQLLARSRQLLEKKLQRALLVDQEMEELKQQLADDLIEYSQYESQMRDLRKDDLSVSVLTSLSKELFNQSQIEQNKPTSITESPADARENLRTLLDAIKSGKEEDIMKAVFLDDKPISITS